MAKLGDTDKDKARRKIELQKKYGQRITIARQGRDAFMQKDFLTATKKYNEYLGILSEMNDLDDIYLLSPRMFDNKKEVTEMLLISHIYWEIARINEMTPKLQKNFNKALNQFVKFTINQPFQVLNSEMLRKYIKKNKGLSQQSAALAEAYQKIFVQSKKCYIATLCLGEQNPHTENLREYKNIIILNKFGLGFVRVYYLVSDKLVSICLKNSLVKYLSILFLRPLVIIFSKLISYCREK